MLTELYQLSQHFLKIYNRQFERYFFKNQQLENRLSILLGQRGIGKTTMIIQYILKNYDLFSKEALYIQADHFLVKKYSLYEIADNFCTYGGKLLCIDEIHKYPDWAMELKSIYDTFPGLKIIASGSSALQIYQTSHDLSRRAIIYKIPVLSFREYIELYYGIVINYISLEEIINNHQQICDNINSAINKLGKKILELFSEYLEYGCYPYFFEIKNKELFYITLEQGIHTTLESDLLSIYPSLTGNSINKIKKLLTFIAGSVPFIPDYTKIKNIIEVSDVRTLKNYFSYLENGGLITLVGKAGKKLDRLDKPEKVYLGTTNQIYAISNNQAADIGSIRETFFLSSLKDKFELTVPAKGDFMVDNKYIFEIGGKNKGFEQIKNQDNAYLAIDGIENGFDKKIPLWLFGFLY